MRLSRNISRLPPFFVLQFRYTCFPCLRTRGPLSRLQLPSRMSLYITNANWPKSNISYSRPDKHSLLSILSWNRTMTFTRLICQWQIPLLNASLLGSRGKQIFPTAQLDRQIVSIYKNTNLPVLLFKCSQNSWYLRPFALEAFLLPASVNNLNPNRKKRDIS